MHVLLTHGNVAMPHGPHDREGVRPRLLDCAFDFSACCPRWPVPFHVTLAVWILLRLLVAQLVFGLSGLNWLFHPASTLLVFLYWPFAASPPELVPSGFYEGTGGRFRTGQRINSLAGEVPEVEESMNLPGAPAPGWIGLGGGRTQERCVSETRGVGPFFDSARELWAERGCPG
jgi:hypothetical protein